MLLLLLLLPLTLFTLLPPSLGQVFLLLAIWRGAPADQKKHAEAKCYGHGLP